MSSSCREPKSSIQKPALRLRASGQPTGFGELAERNFLSAAECHSMSFRRSVQEAGFPGSATERAGFEVSLSWRR